ncbi:MAG: 4-(cytidine 5'-diphospho)-2-C-methyl-D-erythritol kinase [Brevinema sp.]
MTETFVSTSKINLFLNITGKDPYDGYHLIESIFCEIPWGDDFVIEDSEKDQVIFINADIPQQNTVFKTLSLFKEKYDINDHFKISVTKNTPMGAGLGSGSGDAGALLKWLCRRYNIFVLDCLDIAIQVGSDVSFFLYGGNAFVSGKGEKITPLKGQMSQDVHGLIVFPNIHSSTKTAFQQISHKIGVNTHQEKINFFIKNHIWGLDNLKKMIYNVFDNELDSINLTLKEIKNYLTYILSPSYIFMTGSGSSFVLLFNSVSDLRKARLSLNQVKSYSTHFM